MTKTPVVALSRPVMTPTTRLVIRSCRRGTVSFSEASVTSA